MSSGVIPVVLNRGGVGDIVKHDHNGYLAPTAQVGAGQPVATLLWLPSSSCASRAPPAGHPSGLEAAHGRARRQHSCWVVQHWAQPLTRVHNLANFSCAHCAFVLQGIADLTKQVFQLDLTRRAELRRWGTIA